MEEKQARELIAQERQRQRDVEGWTSDHDDQHRDGSLAWAATCYYLHVTGKCTYVANIPLGWPWAAEWWKPKDPVRDLVRAGALYMAEAERLYRLPGSPQLKTSRSGRMTPRVNHIVTLLQAYD